MSGFGIPAPTGKMIEAAAQVIASDQAYGMDVLSELDQIAVRTTARRAVAAALSAHATTGSILDATTAMDTTYTGTCDHCGISVRSYDRGPLIHVFSSESEPGWWTTLECPTRAPSTDLDLPEGETTA